MEAIEKPKSDGRKVEELNAIYKSQTMNKVEDEKRYLGKFAHNERLQLRDG